MKPFFVLIKCHLGKAYEVANAIADATGVRFRDLPFTPPLIYKALNAQFSGAAAG